MISIVGCHRCDLVLRQPVESLNSLKPLTPL
jgi:hypothetical protein